MGECLPGGLTQKIRKGGVMRAGAKVIELLIAIVNGFFGTGGKK
ncbi:MAG: hypothetical protein SVY53_06720 [Chloroflexota bacterium]|nr:hypothetical protein [Chloroflexota bacterium]